MIVCTEIEKQVDARFTTGPISLQVEPGTVTALVGKNGSGKSTILRMLSGMVLPDAGTIERFGQQVEEKEWKNQLAFIPQTSKSFEKYTLSHLAAIYRIGFQTWNEQRFLQLVEQYRLPLNKQISQFSGGMQRVALAVLALSRNSKVLIMDEPFAGVDIESQEWLRAEWLHYLEEDPERAIVFSSHVPDEIKDLADFIICMQDGKQTGCYEKDTLLSSWARFWSVADLNVVRNMAGVQSVIQRGPQIEIISSDNGQTEAAMHAIGLEITMKQPLKMAEILRLLIQEREMEDDA
ncbi:ATP-binding cassette domain-containing protein [Shouchella tritolerans]|uniref:ATP-binding cassette domain-containing protein n=1 Tax=Shouchella tritolerans TaxID=2979466 RepID=UPI0021E7D2B1|nr:ABC transporter ATP-binding protein [Shouchella tritolerans]